MDQRFQRIAALAASHHGVVSSIELHDHGVDSSLRGKWQRRGLIDRLGTRSWALAGSTPTFERRLAAGLFDLNGCGFIAGRAAAQLHRLDGFGGDVAEFIVPRSRRNLVTGDSVRSTVRPLGKADVVTVAGLRCLTAERLILDSPVFGFTANEIENAIDSAIRMKLASETRLRERVLREHSRGVNGSRLLLEAMVDTGGESRLERLFLRIVRTAGLDRPMLQKTYRQGTRVVARVDAYFPGGLVVEVAGHGTHSTRRQRQIDAQRHTDLTLRGLRVITFTYEDVVGRPEWVIARLHEALAWAS